MTKPFHCGGKRPDHAAVALNRAHAAMPFQAGGHSSALRALVKVERERGPDFFRLANALSTLYPHSGAEKRQIDTMPLAAPG